MTPLSTLSRWFSVFTLALSFAPFVSMAGTSEAFAAQTVSTRPVVFVHGFNPFALPENCGEWSAMADALTAQGFTGPKVKIGYYYNDTNCDVSITNKSGTIMTSIEDLSHDLAWYLYNTFSSQGIAIDVVAHSMGGLMTRYALYRVAVGDTDYPPFLKISHVTTLATPHQGYSLTAELCHLIVVNFQCDEMDPLSSFIADLQNPEALLPQGLGGTTWGNVGSNALILDDSDGFVNSDVATSLDIPDSAKLILPWYRFVFHTMYTENDTVIAQVTTNLSDGAASQPQLRRAHLAVPGFVPHAILSRAEMPLKTQALEKTNRPGRADPFMVKGTMQGIRLTQIQSEGVFAKMGLQEGDVIRGCTADTLNSPFEALSALETPSDEPVDLTFCVLRNGVETQKLIQILN